MHAEVLNWVARQLAALPPATSVLEIGAYNVNGSARVLLPAGATVYGIDVRDGPGVDAVIDASKFDGEQQYDLVLCTETLEHAEAPEAIIASAWRALKPGGVLLLTAASPERAPHSCDGAPRVPKDEHYGGIDPRELGRWLDGWDLVAIEHFASRGDVYARAVKPKPRKSAAKG